jgi:hypothetical protein
MIRECKLALMGTGGLAVLVLLIAYPNIGSSIKEVIASLVVFGVIAVFYFFPTIVALLRDHHKLSAIAVLNFLLGWTFLGWVAALVWACAAVRPFSEQLHSQTATVLTEASGYTYKGRGKVATEMYAS